ncbi:S9 family peptidase [Halobacillus locisalis]|uniref:S9 family peptidase n=1 Tax=Halobacillus locisalis TaxID=220753 RepID=A0A838CUG0_9BACI|nr:prolyl oligopeptidase family serine peptidase [Halobacillus locisalis]MBA2175415.1 S9 family peptidase [Halobacillus locisalis]
MKKLFFVLVLLWLVGCEAGAESIIVSQEKIDVPQTTHSETTETHRFTYLSDGLEVVGYMVKPKEVDKELPLLIYNRGGNQELGKINDQTLATYLSYWANKGYIVLASQYRGNDGGEGKEEYGGSDVNDVLNLARVAEEIPNVDEDNTVMVGKSRGGMMTYLAIKNEMELKAAAIVAGPTDLTLGFDNRGAGMKRMMIDLIGAPSDNPEAYKDRSAVYWPDEIDVPTLILHGENDWRVSVERARKLSEKLSEVNADYEYIEYENDDHDLSNHSEEYKEKVHQWFQKYID